MQYEAKTPEEYFKLLDDDWRKEKLLIVRRFITENAPELEESIQYKMLSYGKGTCTLFGLNAQKSYVSLYVGDIEKIKKAKELLTGFDYGKGCIRIRKSLDLHNSTLEDFVKSAIDTWKSNGDTSC